MVTKLNVRSLYSMPKAVGVSWQVVSQTVLLAVLRVVLRVAGRRDRKNHMSEFYELLAVVFDDVDVAKRALALLIEKRKKGEISIFDIAVVEKGENGEANIKEPGDVDAKHGAVFGAIAGGLIGLIGGPIGVVVGVAGGAVTGGIAAERIDMGFSNEFLNDLAEALKPGRSAIILICEEEASEYVIAVIAKLRGIVLRHALKQEIVAQLVEAQKE